MRKFGQLPKYSIEDIVFFKELEAGGMSRNAISREYNINITRLRKILDGQYISREEEIRIRYETLREEENTRLFNKYKALYKACACLQTANQYKKSHRE